MRKTSWSWIAPGALLAAMALAGCGGGGGGGGGSAPSAPPTGTIGTGTGSGGTGTGGGGTTNSGSFPLTATPEHGFVQLSWTAPANATNSTTYTVERAVAGTTSFVVPTGPSGSATGLTGTTFEDSAFATTPNQSAPVYGQSYQYYVVASNGAQTATSAAVTPTGTPPGIAFATVQNGTTTLSSTAPSPFVNSGSGVTYTYTTTQAAPSAPKIVLTMSLDYTPAATDLRSVTINENSGDIVLTPAQIQQGTTVSGNVITFDSSRLTGTDVIPAMIPGSLVTINTYVNAASGNTSQEGVVQITNPVPAVGQANNGTAPFDLVVQNQSF